jgi:hypothetical protein
MVCSKAGDAVMSDINILRPEFNKTFALNGTFAEALYKVVLEYDKQVSAAEVIGVLEIVKTYVIQAQREGL